MKNKKIGVIGIGHLGQAMTIGLSKAGYEVYVNNGKRKRTQEKLKKASINSAQASSLREIAKNCQTIVLCIKHGQLATVAAELNHLLNKDHLVVSALAQATLCETQALFSCSHPQIVKLMTTLGVRDRKGVSAYQLVSITDSDLEQRVIKLLKAVSAKKCVLKLETEAEMQLFTIVVGCFPGIEAYILRQLELSAQKYGGEKFSVYSQMLSTLLRSTADLLDTAGTAADLEEKVKTPGGVTEAIINTLEHNSGIFDQAFMAGLERMKM